MTRLAAGYIVLLVVVKADGVIPYSLSADG